MLAAEDTVPDTVRVGDPLVEFPLWNTSGYGPVSPKGLE